MDNLLIKDILSLNASQFAEAFKDKCYNFYDWFCREHSLEGKSKSLFGKAKKLVKANTKSNRFDFSGDGTYTFFKNNCPCYGDGRLYDSFSICEGNDDGTVICWIAPKNPFGYAEIAFKGHGFESETHGLSFKSFKDLCKWIECPENFEETVVKGDIHLYIEKAA